MVCLPCLVIPFFIWFFHKYIQPYVMAYWNPAAIEMKQFKAPKGKEESKEYLYLEEFVGKSAVIIFSKTTCTFCKMATDLLKQNGIPYVVENIDLQDNMSEIQDLLLEITGERTVPRIFIGKESVGGSSDLFTLHNKGKLVDIAKSAGAIIEVEAEQSGDSKKDL